MKKLALALLLSAGLVNPSFAAKSKVAELDATIDEVSAQMDDQEAKGALAWMKKHKVATALIGTATLAGTFVAVDALCHFMKKEDKDAAWSKNMLTVRAFNKVKGLFASKSEDKAGKKAKKAVETDEADEKAPKAKKAKPAKDAAEAKGKLEWVKENKGKVIASGLGLVAAILVTYDLTRAEKASLIKQLYAKVFKKNAEAAVVA